MVPRLLLIAIVAGIAAAGWFATWGLWRYGDAVRDLAALETRRFDAPTLILLGTGEATENPSRAGPAVAFASGTTVLLVDAELANQLSGLEIDHEETPAGWQLTVRQATD